MGQAQINVRTRACSRTSIARTKQAALTHSVRGKRLNKVFMICLNKVYTYPCVSLDSVVLGATTPGVSDCKTHSLFVLLSASAVKTTTVVQYVSLYRVRTVMK